MTDGERYEVQRDGKKVDTVSTPSYTDNNVDPDTTYKYKVKADADSTGKVEYIKSDLSGQLKVTTEADTSGGGGQ